MTYECVVCEKKCNEDECAKLAEGIECCFECLEKREKKATEI